MSTDNSANAEVGSEVPEVETTHLGFKALSQGGAGPKKVKVLPQPWPTNRVPPACASLLSIASKPGLLAAAGPEVLVVASTEKVRKAFDGNAPDNDVVSDFTPDVTIPVPTLRHVAFSTDGDFLVISAEEKGGLAIFSPAEIVKGNHNPSRQIETDQVAVRTLLPNPMPEYGPFFASVFDSGKLAIINAEDGRTKTLRSESVTCVAWSTKGRAVVAGLHDGTLAIHMISGDLRGVIPRPPEVKDTYTVSGIAWLNNEDFLIVHSPKHPDLEDSPDSKYHFVKSNKGWTSFTFHPFPWDPLLTVPDMPQRNFPPRFSVARLRNWEPALDDMLIVTNSHTDAVVVLATTSDKISPYQENLNEFMTVALEDTRKAAAPRTVFAEEEGDSVFIGEALDLSATEKLLAPVKSLQEEGINEAPWPLPAYMGLTHEGVLTAWWVVWDKSIGAGKRYPGLIVGSEEAQSAAAATTPKNTSTPSAPSTVGGNSVFGKPTATFGSPAGPMFGSPGFGSPAAALMKPTPPGFGTPAFGSTSTKPLQPAFGAPSSMGAGGGTTFGAAGGLGNKQSPWGTPSQTTQTQASPFSAAAGGASGFAKFGQTGGSSAFSSFGSTSGAQSGFGSLGQGQQKSSFGALKTEPSFGSTVTVASGTGSTLPSWANTPAQSSGSIFGQQSKSSFNTSSFESKSSDMSDAEDAQRRQRDDATPTPQVQPQQSKGMFGLAGGFKLGSTFTSDGTAKDDPAKPMAPSTGSFFESDFANTLDKTSLKPPATPAKESPENVSTTPASPPKQKSFFPSTTPAKDSATPKAPPPAQKTQVEDAPLPPDFVTAKPAKVDDAPLPPDFITAKPPKAAEDDLPPLAGSPGIKVEAPSSEIEVSPLDDEDAEDEDDFEDEDEDGEDEDEEEGEPPASSAAPSKSQPSKTGWSFQDSVSQPSPRVFPPAPTPPAVKSGATSQSGGSGSPAQPSLFGQAGKSAGNQSGYAGSSLFGQPPPQQQPPQKGSFPFGRSDQPLMPPKPNFPPPTNRIQESLRSPSPVRSVSTSALRTARREPLVAPGTSLSSSIQQAKPPTPQPQVSDLEDEEDERMREQLARPIEPSRTLDEFVAYQNYTGNKSPTKTGHAAQIEMIYKDINGMVDALGWNARSMRSFTYYHSQPQRGHKVNRQVLEDVADEGQDGSWFEKFTICEIVALKALEDELERELDAGRVQDVLDKLAQLARLLREKAKLMTRLNDIRRQIINRKDPDKTEALRKAPLPKELADGQKALRNDYAQLLTSLHKAEDASSILRSRLASHNAQNGKTGAVPTMDAVKRTIAKLASLAEKRNNDITLLESQLRKTSLSDSQSHSRGTSSPARTPRRSRGTSLRSSIAESPFVTPPTSRMSLSELNRRALTPEVDATPTQKGYGLFYSEEGSGTQLARLSDLVDENMDGLRETARRRRAVAGGLKKALVERGVKSTKLAGA